MKKFLRFPLYAAMAAMMTFNFSACSDDDDPDGGDTELSEKDKRYQAIADQFTKNTVIVTYTGLADQTEALVEKLKALKVRNPYNDLAESFWGYTDLMEATVSHTAEEWHDAKYNDGKYNLSLIHI